MEGVVIVLVVAALIAFVAAYWRYQQKRRQEFAAVATSLGWQYSPDDTFGLLGLPFELLRRGDGRGTENVLWGARAEHDIRGFDYWYYETSTDAQGHRTRSYSRFSCAVLELPVECPSTSISEESLLTRLADAIGFDDIDFEWEDFNRAMQVKSADKRFANYLIDARAMEWLMANRGWTFMLSGRFLMAVIHRMRPREFPQLIEILVAFRAQIPRVVFDTYGHA
jgi:hypothetical protein